MCLFHLNVDAKTVLKDTGFFYRNVGAQHSLFLKVGGGIKGFITKKHMIFDNILIISIKKSDQLRL